MNSNFVIQNTPFLLIELRKGGKQSEALCSGRGLLAQS